MREMNIKSSSIVKTPLVILVFILVLLTTCINSQGVESDPNKEENTYTIDQINGSLAVLLEKGNESNRKDVEIELLPKEIKEGDIVKAVIEDGKIHYSILYEETYQRRLKAIQLLNKLQQR